MGKGRARKPVTEACPVCVGTKKGCPRCGGSGLVLVEEAEDEGEDLGTIDAETAEVLAAYAFIIEHGLGPWITIHGEMSAEGWRRLGIFKGELDRLDTREREAKASEERKRCRKKP